MSARRHFHVLVGLSGMYMPNENHVYLTRREAEGGARLIADRFRDDGERVTGSARSGYYAVGESECIEITDCDRAECLRDLDE
jgi:hypothetical protein